MQLTKVVNYLLALNGAQESYPFGPQTQVFKVMDKMYALIGFRNGKYFINLKAKPEDVLFLTEQYPGITPGYHMNKLHWVSVDISDPSIDAMLEELINTSYQLIVSKLSKKQQLSLTSGE